MKKHKTQILSANTVHIVSFRVCCLDRRKLGCPRVSTCKRRRQSSAMAIATQRHKSPIQYRGTIGIYRCYYIILHCIDSYHPSRALSIRCRQAMRRLFCTALYRIRHCRPTNEAGAITIHVYMSHYSGISSSLKRSPHHSDLCFTSEKKLTGQLADKPTRGQSSRGLDNSRTGQLAGSEFLKIMELLYFICTLNQTLTLTLTLSNIDSI